MLSSKSKSGLSDVANNKNILASKIGRTRPAKLDVDSPPSQKTTSFSVNGSPNSADYKPVVNRRSTKISTTPDKYSRLLKGSELQLQLSSAQEDLKTAKEKIAFQEIERANVLDELRDAKKAVVEVSEKLGAALLSLKKAEESSMLEKFHAEKLKQESIEPAQKREEKWQKELEDISNQRAVDVSALQSVTQELNNELEVELGITREDSEKSRKAMEGLASALHEVSMEARDMQERLLIKQAELESTTGELDRVHSSLKINKETFEVMLDEAKYEIACLKKSIDKSEKEAKNLRSEWDAREINLRTAIKKADEEIASMKLERHQAMEKLERENFNKLRDKIRQAESELIEANKVIEKEKQESKCLKERLLAKENELQRITKENYELRARETASSEKINELSESLAKVSSKKNEDNGDSSRNTEYGLNGLLSNNGNEHTIMHKMIVVMDDKVDETETENSEEAWELIKDDTKLDENGAEEHPVQIEPKICEDGGETTDNKMLCESTENELKPKIVDGKLDQVNGRLAQNGKTYEIKHQLLQKKKKALLNKFGDLLKKTTSK